MMKKADLHVHSKYSEHPSEWFLRKLGTRESYSEPQIIYSAAMENGMDFVTITDHNRIDGVMFLKEKYPAHVITGVESTAYFPEDGCKVHLLVYGFTPSQFAEIDRVRTDIYQLRNYLRSENLACSVAHATFSINKKLTLAHIERLLLLFDVFETANGAGTHRANDDFLQVLISLTPDHFTDLRRKHRLEPWSAEPWKKGFTGGSDDHSGLRIASMYTTVKDAAAPEQFLEKILRRQSFTEGRSSDYREFAFSLYKIAYDFTKERGSGISSTVLSALNDTLFENGRQNLRNRLAITRIKMKKQKKDKNGIGMHLAQLFSELERMKKEPIDAKLTALYEKIGTLSDQLMRTYFESIVNGIAEGDVASLVQAVSGMLPVVFLSVPFVSTVNVLHGSRVLQEQLDDRFGLTAKKRKKRLLWFTDTLTDLNGQSETIQKMAWLSFFRDRDLRPVACLLPDEKKKVLPPNVIALPVAWSHDIPVFSFYTLRIPSILASIRMITEEEPDEILVSTPGPVGLLGILLARLLHIPCRGIFYTDFPEQAACITGDRSAGSIVEEYVRWFYGQCRELLVPTRQYRSILSERGYPDNMSLFRIGVETDLFHRVDDAKTECSRKYGIPDTNHTLLCVGRISAEKQVDFILDVYEQCILNRPGVNLVFAGSGPEPYFSQFKKRAAAFHHVFFIGRIPRNDLPLVYSAADMLLFPGTADTFGMAVLEAQACGVPVLVSDTGGPQEIVTNGKTGFILEALNRSMWCRSVSGLLDMLDHEPERYFEMGAAARNSVEERYGWQKALDDLFNGNGKRGCRLQAPMRNASDIRDTIVAHRSTADGGTS